MNRENLGPADQMMQVLIHHHEHLYHGRPGAKFPDPTNPSGIRWVPVTHKVENNEKVVYTLHKVGPKTRKTRIGVLGEDGRITERGTVVATYAPPGPCEEVVVAAYKQIVEIGKLDNEFAARAASYIFAQQYRDLKCLFAAYELVQPRKGDPVLEGGKVVFYDEDFRSVGEAMVLGTPKEPKAMDPKMMLRVHDILSLDGVAKVNYENGFGRSTKRPFLGRYPETVEKFLRQLELNPKRLAGFLKAGFRSQIMQLSRSIGFKPETEQFFQTMRWKQVQAKDGRRTIAIGKEVSAAETWKGLSEEQICEKIVEIKPNYKRIVGLLPPEIGVTRPIMAAAIEAGALSNKDLIIATPTLEDLGLLNVQDIRERWEKAVREADDMRAANIAARVKSQEAKEKLQEASDNAVKKAVEDVSRGLRVYFMVDISGSMQNSIASAKAYIAKFLQAFPPDRVHVAVFNTTAREIRIPHASAAGVENAFRGITASGGTNYAAPLSQACLGKYRPEPGEDVLFFFVGDEEANVFDAAVRASGLNPVAFAFVKTVPVGGAAGWRHANYAETSAVRETANKLGIPCVMVNPETFDDVYAIPRTLRNLVAATPVGAPAAGVQPKRETLVDRIINTELICKPNWA